MAVFDLLTDKDKDNIIRYIGAFGPIADNSDIPNLSDVDTVLAEWNKEKSKYLEKLFGGQLILNRPYTYAIAQDGVEREIAEAINTPEAKCYWDMKKWVKHTLCDIGGIPWMTLYHITNDIFEPNVLAANAYDGESFKIEFPDGEIWKIPTGMKPMKILHKVIVKFGDEYAEELYEEYRNWHSRLLNQTFLDGTLSLSIHPLDFMTMSDNGGSWTSCMRWQSAADDDCDPGDYRMGTVECMNSPYIIIAYLHNPNKTNDFMEGWYGPSLIWNKKKWRELFIVQDGIITEIKGYPFQDENLSNTALMWIKELAQNNLGWTYNDVEVNVNGEYETEEGNNLFRFRVGPSGYMYNDFGTLKKHRARVNFNALKRRNKESSEIQITEYMPRNSNKYNIIYEIPYGGRATCMCCGQYVPYYDNRTNEVFCRDCEHSQICPCCGEYFDEEGYTVSAYEEPICSACFDYECSHDDLGGDREYSGSMIDIFLKLGTDKNGKPVYYSNSISTLDPNSYDNYSYQKLFTDVPFTDSTGTGWSPIYYITFNMIKDTDWAEEVFDIDLSLENLYEIMLEKGCVEAEDLAKELEYVET